MPHNKKHHFVPKFYLRNFSADQKSIGLYNIASGRMIARGNLKNQCYRDYFYGKDLKVEHALAGVESAAAYVINHLIMANEAVPVPLSAEHVVLSQFVVLQSARTGYAAEELAEATDKFFKAVYRDQFGDLSNYQIGFSDPVLMALQVASRMAPAIYDLKIKLLRNETSMGLITSDNPIVRHNQHFEGNDYAGHAGYGQAGLQIFLPLSPKYLILLYDAGTYKVGDKKSRVISVDSSSDITELNALQWLNAHENVYFADGEGATVEAQGPRVIGRRRAEKSSVEEHPLVYRPKDRDAEGARSLLHHFKFGLNIRFKVDPIKIRRRPRHPYHPFRPAPARDDDYSKLVEEFAQLVSKKQANPEDFFAFAAKHPRAKRR